MVCQGSMDRVSPSARWSYILAVDNSPATDFWLHVLCFGKERCQSIKDVMEESFPLKTLME